MQEAVYIAWIIFQLLIGFHLVMPILLYELFLFKKKQAENYNHSASEADYAIIVTAYEETHNLPAVVSSLLKMHYSNYLVYIVADKCDISDLHFADERVIILRPPDSLGSNTRSHFYAINRFRRNHERITIIDSDNITDADYLKQLNIYFDKGFKAVQGLRQAKNTDTFYAKLDAARDHYYHFYDGEVLFALGSSSTLAGSGMAFTVELYKLALQHLDVTGAGFDKVLQYQILLQNERIAFAPAAMVFDEKTSKSDQLVNQRARWINTWFRYFSKGFVLIKNGLANLNWNQFLFGVILLRPPLFIFLLLSLFCLVLNLWISLLAVALWLIGYLLFILAFVLALVHTKAEKKIYQAMLTAPLFIFYQVLSLRKVRHANKHSVATNHQAREQQTNNNI